MAAQIRDNQNCSSSQRLQDRKGESHRRQLESDYPKEVEASPHKRRLKCDTKHQSQEADATFITSDGSKPYKPWRTLDTDNNNN